MSTPQIPAGRADFARWCEAEGIDTVVAGAGDVHGIWRGKRLPLTEFLAKIDHGVAFSDVVLVLTHSEDTDEGQELVEPPGGAAYPLYFPRKEQGFPDIFVRPDLGTARRLPWHPGTVGSAGSSGHIHQSLWETGTGGNAFFARDGGGLSETGRHYTAGLLATMREFTALFAPTPNSYKRFAPYSWAGTSVSWSYDNRSTGLRAIAGGPQEARIEHRLPGADTSPYVVIAACLAGGLRGIEHKLPLTEAYAGDAYATGRLVSVPQTLDEALDLLEGSEAAREMLGADFTAHYVAMKRFEAEKYRLQVSDWEVRRYAEMA